MGDKLKWVIRNNYCKLYKRRIEMADFGDTIPYTVGNNTLDLSRQLEKQLDEQLVDDNFGSVGENNVQQEVKAPEPSHTQEIPVENPRKEEKSTGMKKEHRIQHTETPDKEKTVSMINESKYLRYIAELRKADSELALAKAESAELVLQMNNYKEHYEEYEEIIQQLINEHDRMLAGHIKTLTGLAQSIQNNSDSLSSRIDDEIRRLVKALSDSIEGNIKKSCDEELVKVEEATQVLYDYSEKVKGQYIKFQKLEKVKFGLFILSSVSAPIVLVLMILNMLHII